MRFENFKVLVVLVGLTALSATQAEVKEKEGKEKERERMTIEEQLRRRQGTTGEKANELGKEKEESKALNERFRNADKGGTPLGQGSGGIGVQTKGKAKSLNSAGSHQGESESVEFGGNRRIPGAGSAELVGSGGREEAPEVELKGKEKETVAKAAKEEDDALAATGKDGKNQTERIESVKNYEREKSFYKRDSSGKLVETESKPGVSAFVEKLAKLANPRTETLDLAIKTLAEKMLAQGKSIEELEPILKDFIEFWNKEVKGKLPAELQKNGLAYMLASLHRGPMALAKLKTTLTELLKEENPEVVLKGLVLSNTAYGEIFLKGLKDGLSIADAHEKALANKVAFLKEKGLTAEEISELPKCEMTNLLGVSRFLLRSGH